MTRQFRHNSSWSSLDDAWSGHVRLRCFDTISLRDARLAAKQAANEARHQKRRSERAACLAAGPLPHLRRLSRFHVFPYTGTIAPRVTLFAGEARKRIVAATSSTLGHSA